MFGMTNKDKHTKDLTESIRRIVHKHLELSESPLRLREDLKLTPREILFIQAIGEKLDSNVKDLGETLGVTKSAASQMVQKLEKKNLVHKGKACDNDKEVIVTLTQLGTEAFRINRDFDEKHLSRLNRKLEGFSDSQILMASSILSVIEETVDSKIKEISRRTPLEK